MTVTSSCPGGTGVQTDPHDRHRHVWLFPRAELRERDASAHQRLRLLFPAMPKRRATQLQLDILPQPDDTTCGPTCLHAVYRYWGDEIPLARLVNEIDPLPGGGTLAVSLACHALRRGYRAEIYTYNLQLFDPSWFVEGVDLAERLSAQRKHKRSRKLAISTDAYLEYLSLGGVVRFEELRPALIRRFLNRDTPLLTGLSATYLYQCPREHEDDYDDVRGEPVGHFVVLSGYERKKSQVTVSDPSHDNPRFRTHLYSVGMNRLIAAIALGVMTYDANVLVLTPTAASSEVKK